LGWARGVAPAYVPGDRLALLGVGAVIGAVEREVTHGRELGFDPVQPGGAGRQEHQLHAVGGRPAGDLRILVRREVVRDHMQRYPAHSAPELTSAPTIARRSRTGSFAVRPIRCSRCPSAIETRRTNTSGPRPMTTSRSAWKAAWTLPGQRSITRTTFIDAALVTHALGVRAGAAAGMPLAAAPVQPRTLRHAIVDKKAA